MMSRESDSGSNHGMNPGDDAQHARRTPTARAVQALRDPSDQEALNLEQNAIPQAIVENAVNSSYGPLRRKASMFSSRHVSLAVPQTKCRDHFGKSRLDAMQERAGSSMRKRHS